MCVQAAPRTCCRRNSSSSQAPALRTHQMLEDKQNAFTGPEPIYFCNNSEFLDFFCTWCIPALRLEQPSIQNRQEELGKGSTALLPCFGCNPQVTLGRAGQPCWALHKLQLRCWQVPCPRDTHTAIPAGTWVLSWGLPGTAMGDTTSLQPAEGLFPGGRNPRVTLRLAVSRPKGPSNGLITDT